MYFYKNEENIKIYTLKPKNNNYFTEVAHPAKFSPEDEFSEERITIKKRFNIFPFNK